MISVGEANPFGQPAEIVVERYAREGVRLLRTDRYGELTVQTDGNSLACSRLRAVMHEGVMKQGASRDCLFRRKLELLARLGGAASAGFFDESAGFLRL